MIIAYISFEHPLGISGGGIGTYIDQLSTIMASRGHQIELFCGTTDLKISQIFTRGCLLTLIPAKNNEEFRANVLPVFSARHSIVSFDLIESAEYGADALLIKKRFPKLPLTVKLHTPTFYTTELNSFNRSFVDKLRFVAGGLLRGKISKPYWKYRLKDDPEYELFCLAETSSSTSKSLADVVISKWNTTKHIEILPPPFLINEDLSAVRPPANKSSGIRVTFIGKLEKRKGVLDLMNAIPGVLKRFPDTQFCFVGKAHMSPDPKMNMEQFIKTRLRDHVSSLKFTGFKEYAEIPGLIENSDICIYPSLWEAFGYVCLESMAAGRAVIGYHSGGMAEIIKDGIDGILIKPKSPKAIQQAICDLICFPEKRFQLGIEARKSIQRNYNSELVGKMNEEFYQKTISFHE